MKRTSFSGAIIVYLATL